MTTQNKITEQRQGNYPFLTALKWQGDRARLLSDHEAIALYERNWRHVDILATPTEQEIFYILEIAREHNSWLTSECNRRVDHAASNLAH